MATVAQDVAAIRNAVYGGDVREAIADGIEKCYTNVSSAKTIADPSITTMQGLISDVSDALDNVDTKIGEIDSAVINANAAAENVGLIAQTIVDGSIATPEEVAVYLGIEYDSEG